MSDLHPDHAANIGYRDALHTLIQKVENGWVKLTIKDLRRELAMTERCVQLDAEFAATEIGTPE